MVFVIDNKEMILVIIDGWSGKFIYDFFLERF